MRNLILLITLLFSTILFSQTLDPIKWKASVEKETEDTYVLHFKATLDKGWHLYSQNEAEGDEIAPTPTEFTFDNTPQTYTLVGETNEPNGIEKYDNIFEMDVKYFEDKAVFFQKIKLVDKNIKQINAEVFFSVCDDERCLAPEIVQFNINLDGAAVENKGDLSSITAKDQEKSKGLDINVKGWDVYPSEDTEEKSYFTIFILGFLGGLIALLTPCVFPMIPLTVSFFTKGNKDRKKGLFNAILYAFFIFIIYILLSLPFHLLDSLDPEILNNISTNVTLNIVFFVIFIVFAISFFGYFEITLPASWSNKLDSKANSIGGVIGIFFMALTLALVSFSCTGPILGSLLGGSLSSDGGAMQLSFGMGGFGLALALPFGLFALFPNWLNSLPKSGGWLNTVKVVLGFVELALAFKFLSNADLVEHWGILKREIFIGIWIVIGVVMVLYLFGKIRFPHDSPIQKLSIGRKTLGVLILAFVIYLIPGLTNTTYANLKLLSGFPPPLFYSIYEKEAHGPLGLNAYTDFEEGLKAAKIQNKPIILDFTGWACVNCRKMEEQVWSHPEIMDILKNEYILISLYVDDRKELSEKDQFKYLKSEGRVKDIRTIGDKWATFQTLNFKNNSQPYYVLLDTDINLLNHTTAYTPDTDEYLKWLKTGLKNYKK
ncbi:protein-disulfide reductase DsbD family protein [Aquimarina muelleri]|uniref:Thiol:disulfide interchange protein DsbD n=1 Tax=Aquimarina muelleri TaxID=279356 RepID=A0A918N4Y7_9FLAO|nr:thioredoxin family protein [Aquimarina muelleri]MCX2763314.1 protein-disulfide reductase DsbD family protein [Aquimarina muelleri]GGX26246.1 thiol:disulfide interchange protein DsbD [Aquimarina muelleri]